MPRSEDLPEERIVITYDDYSGGALKKVILPFKLLLIGDYSGGTSKDRQDDLEVRRIRELNEENLNSNIKDMGIHMRMKVQNVLVQGNEEMTVDMPIEGVHSFSPDEVVKKVPVTKRLMDMRDTLKEISAQASNDTDIVKLLEKMLEDPAAAKRLARYKLPSVEKLDAPGESKPS